MLGLQYKHKTFKCNKYISIKAELWAWKRKHLSVIKSRNLYTFTLLQTINFATRKQQCCVLLNHRETKFPRNKKLCMGNLYQWLVFYFHVMTQATYKEECVTRFTMKQQFMKLNKMEKIKRWDNEPKILWFTFVSVTSSYNSSIFSFCYLTIQNFLFYLRYTNRVHLII